MVFVCARIKRSVSASSFVSIGLDNVDYLNGLVPYEFRFWLEIIGDLIIVH